MIPYYSSNNNNNNMLQHHLIHSVLKPGHNFRLLKAHLHWKLNCVCCSKEEAKIEKLFPIIENL